jgi:Ca-activated chloride channel family protein
MNTLLEQWPLALEQFHWLRPWWLLAILPVLLLALILWRQRRAAKQWQAIIAPELLPFLLDGKSVRHSPWQFWLLACAWTLAVIALAGPTWEKRTLPVHQNENALILVLDLSPSMLTEDIKPSRLIRARLKIADILRERREGLTALLVYAGDAHVVAPLTDDNSTINNMLSALHPGIMPAAGSNTEAAIARALQLLRDGGATQGDILLITDGVIAEAQSAIRQQLQGGAFRLSVLGVGGDSPAPIPGNSGSFVRDYNNNIVTTQLNSDELRTLAQQNAGRYRTLSNDNGDIEWLLSQPAPLTDQYQQIEREFDIWYDRGYWLIFLLLPVILYCFRRGVLIALVIAPGFLMYAPEGSAQESNAQESNAKENNVLERHAMESAALENKALEWRDIWRTPDQQGQQALQEGDAERAAEAFKDPQWKASALYRAGDYANAAKHFAQGDSANDFYNLGNALSKAGQLEKGIEAYDEALKRQPDFPQAEANRDLVRKFLEQQNQQNQNNNEQQDKDQQNKENQDQQNEQKDQSDQQNTDEKQDSDNKQDSDDNESRDDQQQNDQQNPDPEPQSDQQNSSDGNSDAGENDQPEQNGEQSSSVPNESEQSGSSSSAVAADQNEEGSEQAAQFAAGENELSDEEQQAMEQWLRRVPDDPSGLLRNKFRYQYDQERQRKFGHFPRPDEADKQRW